MGPNVSASSVPWLGDSSLLCYFFWVALLLLDTSSRSMNENDCLGFDPWYRGLVPLQPFR